MIDTPHLPWLTVLLAITVFGDALMSIRPPGFIQKCLDGVNFPRDWWWVLIWVKVLAAAGLTLGLKYPGVGVAANVGVIAYFLAASYAHYRAKYMKQEFWLNCLGMLAVSIAVLVVSYAI